VRAEPKASGFVVEHHADMFRRWGDAIATGAPTALNFVKRFT
jgi:hypothetical protein